MSHVLSLKEGFLAEWLALPAKEQAQIGGKLKMLTADPKPDAKTKKQLKYLNRHVYRIRSGNFRVFYTFDDRFVSLLKIDRRDDDTYDTDIEAEHYGGPTDSLDESPADRQPTAHHRPTTTSQTVRTLPVKLDDELVRSRRLLRAGTSNPAEGSRCDSSAIPTGQVLAASSEWERAAVGLPCRSPGAAGSRPHRIDRSGLRRSAFNRR